MGGMLSQTTEMTIQESTRPSCERCSGCVAPEIFTDLESDSGYSTFEVYRCIQCGNMIDEVILRNRSLSNPEALCLAAACMMDNQLITGSLHEGRLFDGQLLLSRVFSKRSPSHDPRQFTISKTSHRDIETA